MYFPIQVWKTPEQNGMQTNFLLGALAISPEAQIVLKRVPLDLIARHAINDHGLITRRERATNVLSMQTVGPIVSRYRIDPTNPKAGFVVIKTDEHWTSTLVEIE